MMSFETRCASLSQQLQALPDKPEEDARSTLAALWMLASGAALSAEAATSKVLPPLSAQGEERLGEYLTRRLRGEPLAYITGRQCFLGVEMLAEPAALIPRRETELLAQAAIESAQELLRRRGKLLVVDVCTGSGNLAVAVATRVPQAQVFAADLSATAVDLARRNAALHGLSARLQVREGDLLLPFDEAAFHGQIDLVICNPPYISTKKLETMPSEIVAFEPAMAFDGGPLGVRIVQRLLREAPQYLRPGGRIAFEVGSGQGPAVIKRMQQAGTYENIKGLSDASGEIRAVVADRKHGEVA